MTTNGTVPTPTDSNTDLSLSDQVDLSALLSAAIVETTAVRVEIPPAIVKFLRQQLAMFAPQAEGGQGNRHKVPMVIANDGLARGILANRPDTAELTGEELHKAAAEELKRQLATFAADNGRELQLPKHVPAHWSRKDADPKTGEYVVDKSTGKVAKAKWIADNGVDPTWNNGRQVTFRFYTPKADD